MANAAPPDPIDLAKEADFQLGRILVRPATRQVESEGASETLEPRIMQVLVALARRRGEVVSRDELIETCWEGRIVGDDALNRCVARIRKLGEAKGDFRLETIPRVGYRLWEKDTPQAPEAAASPAPAADGRLDRKLHRRRVLIPAAVGLALLAAAGTWFGMANRRTAEVRPVMTLAVLPFDAPDGDAETRRLADALAPAIANKLTISGQTVVAQSQSAQIVGPQKAQAAKILNAKFLVDGSVARDGDIAHIFVRVDHAARGVTMWSTTIDADARQPLLIADRLSALVARTISWRGAINILNSNDPNALQNAQALLQIIQKSDEFGDDRGAMDAAKRFREIAPKLAFAHGMAAVETMDALPILEPAERMAAFREAREAARVANTLPEGQFGTRTAALAVVPAYAWGERIAGFEEDEAGSAGEPRYLAESYLRVGRLNAALDAADKAHAADPYSKSTMRVRAQVFSALNDKGQADNAISEALLTWPNNPYFPEMRFLAEALLGSADKARALLDQPGVWRPGEVHRDLLSKFLEARRAPDAKRHKAVSDACDLRRTARDDKAMTYCFSTLAALNRRDEAFAIADRLFPDIRPGPGEDPDANWLKAPATAWDPIVLYMPWTANLRADPRIVPVFERLGLLDYWRTTGHWPDFCETEPQSVCKQMQGAR